MILLGGLFVQSFQGQIDDSSSKPKTKPGLNTGLRQIIKQNKLYLQNQD